MVEEGGMDILFGCECSGSRQGFNRDGLQLIDVLDKHFGQEVFGVVECGNVIALNFIALSGLTQRRYGSQTDLLAL